MWCSTLAKQFVLPYLDYEARCNLRQCSKADKALVDSSKLRAHSICLFEIPSEMQREKTIIKVQIDSFTMWFIGRDDVTKVDRAWNEEIDNDLSELKQENRYDVAKRFLSKIGKFEADEVIICNVDLAPDDNFQIKCRELDVVGVSAENTICWLSKVKSKLERLTVEGDDLIGIGPVVSNIHVSRAVTLVGSISDFTFEHIEHFDATSIEIWSIMILPEDIEEMMKRFLKYGRKKDVLKIGVQHLVNYDPIQFIPEGVKYHRKSDIGFIITDGFENVNGVHNPREFYAIPNHIAVNIPEPIVRKKLPHTLWPFSRFG